MYSKFYKLLSVFLLGLLISRQGFAQSWVMVDLTNPGIQTWTPPVGCTKYYVEVWGGGAGGNDNYGGGGSSYSRSIEYTDFFGPITVEVGAGGSNGANGGVSKFRACWAYPGTGNGQTSWVYYGGEIAVSYFGGGGGACSYVSSPWCSARGGGGGGGSALHNSNGISGSDGVTWTDGIYGLPIFCFSNNGAGGAGSGYGGNGGQPGNWIGGGGGGNNTTFPGQGQPGAHGLVRIWYQCNGNAGVIGNPHTVPNPIEKNPDYITSVSLPNPISGITYYWEWRRVSQTNWSTAPGSSNSSTYAIPQLTEDTYFRRRTNSCGPNTSNEVLIKVFSQANGKLNGTINGRVTSLNGTGVSGIQITAQKYNDLKGSPASKTYVTTTDLDGYYEIQNVFYGDLNNGDSSQVAFKITPYKLNHTFSPVRTTSLSNTNPVRVNQNFTDSTVYAITGKTYQVCTTCCDQNGVAIAQDTATLDSVLIHRNGNYITTSAYVNPPGEYGRYAITVENPGNYTIQPNHLGHQFVPASTIVNVQDNVSNVNFKDTTTKEISGYFLAGCSDYIGTAVLEFADIPGLDINGQPRPPEFRKRVTTNLTSGYYSIRLPARKYKVKMISYTSNIPNNGDPDFIYETDIKAFFNTNYDTTLSTSAVPTDSLIRDIRSGNATLNLIYQRPPSVGMYGLADACGQTSGIPYHYRWKQAETKNIGFVVYQGSPAKSCPLSVDSVRLSTNIHVEDVNEEFNIKVVNDTAKITLKGGSPNVLPPYHKVFNVQYHDQYGRAAAQINKNIVVTGVKSDVGFFTTVSPELPLMVVHDPPGDLSYSSWTTSETNETALRWNVGTNLGLERFATVKLGTQLETGLGISTDAKFWGSVNNTLNVNTRFAGGEESILSTTTTQTINTSSDEELNGGASDIYMGGAVNLLYSIATEIADSSTCLIGKSRKLLIAPNGFATTYYYTDDAIRNTVIPTLQTFVGNPGNTQSQNENYSNQISLWQQILANNAMNKARAAFDQNISFFGSSGPLNFSTTSTSTKTSNFDFNLEIEESVAVELGLEVAGSGVNGGVTVRFKLETGVSTTNTTTESTTIGYTLDDNEASDNFTVNVKKDPVYNTPVFETVAGQSSCPPEDNTYHRDNMQFIIPVDNVSGVPVNGDAIFTMSLGNLSQDPSPRTYHLTFDQSSNPYAATVLIGGSPVIGGIPIPYTISSQGSVNVTVVVRKNIANTIYSYEGLRFTLSDACDGSISKTGTISAHFVSPCSPINLVTPENNWVASSANNNSLLVQFDGYTHANLTNITLEYSTTGTSNWNIGFQRAQSQINNSINGTSVNWDISQLPDGEYNLRLKLTCASGTIYSDRVSGIIDRSAPQLFGVPQPSDAVYHNGDIISFSYTEDINNTNLSTSMVSMTRLSDNSSLPVTISGYNNTIAITPLINILPFQGDSIRVVLANVQDQRGNTKNTPDTLYFRVAPFIPNTGPKAVNLSLAFSPKFENASGNMVATFTLNAAATVNTRINFSLGGTATYNVDYSIDSTSAGRMTGTQGFVIIPMGATTATVQIDPTADTLSEPDETVSINILEGGDYYLGSQLFSMATILTDDIRQPVITASGSTGICPGDSVILHLDTCITRRYAVTASGYSSQQSASAVQATGAPDVYPSYGSNANAWSSLTADGGREYLELSFDQPSSINFVDVYETNAPGAVDTIFVKNPNSGAWLAVYSTTASAQPATARILHALFTATTFPVSQIRIALNSAAVAGSNQIDAVAIGERYTSMLWSNGSTSPSITVTTPGVYTVAAANTYGLSSVSDPVTVTLNSVNTVWYADTDADGYGNTAVTTVSCHQPPGYAGQSNDCDDTNADIHPNHPEICDNIDNDCDGLTDNGLTFNDYYIDNDGDGYGTRNAIINYCATPVGYSLFDTDCDDGNPLINPIAAEVCNSIDDDCDSLIDDQDINVYMTLRWSPDADGDSFGEYGNYIFKCVAPPGYVANNDDCDDNNGYINPSMDEICNNIDDNCNGAIDANDANVMGAYGLYPDTDGDGFGDPWNLLISCTMEAGYVLDNSDCNDNDITINPSATEVCNSIDDNCNGFTDSDDPEVQGAPTWYADLDNDGFGSGATSVIACYQPSGFVSDNTDCDENNAAIHPLQAEVCSNGIDDNCNGEIDEAGDLYIQLQGNATICIYDTVTLQSVFPEPPKRYATSVVDFSSEYSIDLWNAAQILGAPNVYPSHGDIPSAWASLDPDNSREHITIGFNDPQPINFIDIYQTYNPGAIDTVYVKNPNTGLYEIVYTTTAAPQAPASSILHVTFPTTSFNVSEIRIALNSGAVPDWNELDAVAIGTLPSYLWSTGETTSSIYVGATGTYSVTATVNGCQSTSPPINITVIPAPLDWYVDQDGDSYGFGTVYQTSCASPGANFVNNNTDCDDGNSGINPGATENCTNDIDDNCNGIIDTDANFFTLFADNDGDGDGNPNDSIITCNLTPGYVFIKTDCDDNNAAANPNLPEICGNGIDDNCSGQIDENNGLHFSMDDDYVSFNNTYPPYNGSMTIESWIKTTTTSGDREIVGWTDTNQGHSVEFRVSNGQLQFGIWDGTSWQAINSSAYVNTGEWTHVAVVKDGNDVRLYINGQADNTGTNTNTITPTTFNIGVSSLALPPYTGYLFDGSLDEVRVWNTVRTQSEISASMYEDVSSAAGLSAYYKLDNGTAGGNNPNDTIVYDASPNRYHGILSGFSLNGSTSNWTNGATRKLYLDSDNDGYGVAGNFIESWCATAGYSAYGTDCNDSDPAIHPELPEICGNGIDDNCNALTDENNALAFDGNDYLEGEISSLPQGNDSRTLEAWVKTTSDGVVFNWGTISTNQRSGMLVIGGRLYFVGENNDAIGNIYVNDGQWHHLALTFDGNMLTGYVDGVLDFTTNKNLSTTGTTLRIGRRAVPEDGEYFIGTIDEVRIWNTVRTQQEIIAGSGGVNMASPGLVAMYKMDIGLPSGNNTSINQIADASNMNPLQLHDFNLSDGNTTSNVVGTDRTLYADADGDGYGDPGNSSTTSCGEGWVLNNTDCDDSQATVHPDATENCGNGIDDNCNGQIDEDCCSGIFVTNTPLFENFESGTLPSGWTATGLWHVSSACTAGTPVDPGNWAYFGQDNTCNFNNGSTVSGDLISPVIHIPSNPQSAELIFSYLYGGEGGTTPNGFDNASVQISVNGGSYSELQSLSTTGSYGNAWLRSVINLQPYAGNDITLKWNFNSMDNWFNESIGLQVDSVAVSISECSTGGTLQLNAFIQGFYWGGGQLAPALLNSGIGSDIMVCDSIQVEIHDVLSPSTILYSENTILSTTGEASITIPQTLFEQQGYIVIKHRNAIQTWSNPVNLTSSMIYDFTTASTQAYANNLTEVEPGVWALFSGDMAPQDEVVDFIDQIMLDNDVVQFNFGYIPTDLNGDGVSDFVDQIILDNNVFNFVSSYHPY